MCVDSTGYVNLAAKESVMLILRYWVSGDTPVGVGGIGGGGVATFFIGQRRRIN